MSIAKNTLYNVAGGLFPAIISIVTVPFYLKVVGVERFGILTLCWLILGYTNFLNLGLGPALSQRLASQSDRSRETQLFWTALWISLVMGFIAIAAVYLCAGIYFDQLEGVPPSLSREIRDALPFLALVTPLALLNGVLVGALQGKERFLSINIISSITASLMNLAPLLIALVVGPELSWLIAGAIISRLISAALLFFACHRAAAVARPVAPNLSIARSLFSFGSWVAVTAIVGPILVSMDRFAIGITLGAAAVSIYTIPYSLLSRIQIIPQGLSSVLFPRFARSPSGSLADLQTSAIVALSVIMTPIVILVVAAIHPFLDIWIGKSLGRQAAPVALILVLGFWINMFARVSFARLQGTGFPDIVAKLHLAELIPYLAVLGVLLHFFGIKGAALAWTCRTTADALALFLFSRVPMFALKQLLIPASLVFVALMVASSFHYQHSTYWALLSVVLLAALTWGGFTMPPSIRRYCTGLALGRNVQGRYR